MEYLEMLSYMFGIILKNNFKGFLLCKNWTQKNNILHNPYNVYLLIHRQLYPEL